MNKKSIIKNSLVILFFLAIILIVTYMYTAQHKRLNQMSYGFQLPFIQSSVRCSEDAPAFLYDIMDNLISKQKSISNQIVYQDSNKLFHCESGWEDGFQGDRPLTVDSRFRYASVSKVVTSAMVLNLVNQGKLHLDDKLVDIINIPPATDERINDITISMLLEHTAGFDRFKTNTPMLTMDAKPWCPTDLSVLAKTTLDFDPNTQYQYSNVGYCLLGAVVEQTTHHSFQQSAQDIYQLDTRNIKFVGKSLLPDEITYDYRYEEFYGADYYTHFDFEDSLVAVGGLAGSAKAMVELTRDMLNERPLNILSRSATPCAIDKFEGCYGYAMVPYQMSGHDFTIYNKSGFFPGVNTDIFVDDQGGILALYRSASTPNNDVKQQLHKKVYLSLEGFYNLRKN